MNIREFTILDQASVIQLQEEFMQEFFPEFANDPRRYQWNADIYNIDEYYIKNGGKIWVVEEDKEIVGVGGFRLVDYEVAEIKRIRIKARYRGKGLGKKIVQMIEEYCVNNNILKILVDTDERLSTAKLMYEKMGYIAYRTEIVVEGNMKYTNHYFEKVLSKSKQLKPKENITG
jgi:putative acetyltransferase